MNQYGPFRVWCELPVQETLSVLSYKLHRTDNLTLNSRLFVSDTLDRIQVPHAPFPYR